MEASPSSLEELCMDKYVSMLEPFTRHFVDDEEQFPTLACLSKLWWRDNFVFGEFLANLFFTKMKLRGLCNDSLLYLFSDRSSSRLRRLDVSESDVTDTGLRYIEGQSLTELNVSRCQWISLCGLTRLFKYQPTLQRLRICDLDFSDNDYTAFRCGDLEDLKNLLELDVSSTTLPSLFLDATFRHLTKIVRLNLDGCLFSDQNAEEYLNLGGLGSLTNIVDLDISCHEVSDLTPLIHVKRTLTRLIMSNCFIDLDDVMDVVVQLDNLQVLDISKHEEHLDNSYRYKVERKDLELLATLPKLTELDLSGVADFGESALACFRQRPEKLHFMGLAQTIACQYPNIPADVVTGRAGEKQMLATLKRYTNRPKYIVGALADLTALNREHLFENITTVIEVVVETLKVLIDNHEVINNGSILLYYVTHSSMNYAGIVSVRNKVLDLVVSMMETFPLDSSIQTSCCFILYNLKLPNDMDSYLEIIISLLIKMCENFTDYHSKRIAVPLLNCCACHINLKQKEVLGEMIVKVMLKVIKKQLDDKETGTVLNTAWSTLWNITDGTPSNSRIFIDNDGLESFHRCFWMHRNDMELIRNILGMIGNVVEVVELHHYLMKPEVVQPIFNLLFKEESELETRYNVCGIICHLAGRAESNWTVAAPSRNEALLQVDREVDSWDYRCQRDMSYISFEPLLRLLQNSYPPQTHHWVVWALINFCHVEPEKYCKLIVNEGGIPLLEELLLNPFTDLRIKSLAQKIMDICKMSAPSQGNKSNLSICS